MWVVKLGGSLAHTGDLALWLRELSRCAAGKVIVVPGGGPFADLIRNEQRWWGFADAIAHRMALRAMDQYGLLLTGLEPALVAVDSRADIEAAVAARQVPVWLPSRMLELDSDIEPSWDVTSDSLAVWLALELGVQKLLLVKSVNLGSEAITERRLATTGVIDAAFSRVRGDRLREVRCVGPGAHRWLPHLLAGTVPIGALVMPSASTLP